MALIFGILFFAFMTSMSRNLYTWKRKDGIRYFFFAIVSGFFALITAQLMLYFLPATLLTNLLVPGIAFVGLVFGWYLVYRTI